MSAFVLNRKYELALPTSYVNVDNEEMEYVEGGSCALPMKSEYLNKNNCLNIADILVRSYQVRNLSRYHIAQEIYAHALCYYGSPTLISALGVAIGTVTVAYLRSHAGVINIDDGPDKYAWAYNIAWNF